MAARYSALQHTLYNSIDFKNIPTYSSQELEYRLTLVPYWFDSFYPSTDEKKVTADIFIKLIEHLNRKRLNGEFRKIKIENSIAVFKKDTLENKIILESEMLGWKFVVSFLDGISNYSARVASFLNASLGVKYPDLTILDIGCCSGTLPYKLNEFLNYFTLGSYLYLGLDKDKHSIDKMQCLLQTTESDINFRTKLLVKDCFNINYKDLIKSPDFLGYDIIIVSHVAYYSSNITALVSEVQNSLINKYGMAFLLHESEMSYSHILNKKYGAPVNAKTDTQIKQALQKSNTTYYDTKVISHAILPLSLKDNMHYFLDDFDDDFEISYNSTSLICSTLHPAVIELKNILEFIPQVSFKTLREKGLLKECLHDLQMIAEVYDNKIPIESNLHIIPPKDYDMNQYKGLDVNLVKCTSENNYSDCPLY